MLASVGFLYAEPMFAQEQSSIPGASSDTLSKSDSLKVIPDSLRKVPLPSLLPVRQVSLFPGKRSGLIAFPTDQFKTETVRQPDGSFLVKRTQFGVEPVPAVGVSFETFAKESLRNAMKENAKRLATEAAAKQDVSRGLLDFKIAIPGGEKSAFTTIFGKNEVNLSVTGRANMSLGASIINDKSLTNQQKTTRVDPAFNQNLQLNIQGTIGDKLSIRTDWDTERPFDYQNRLSIVYEGYEDEILKRIELGNVSMETGNSLVRGGGALFGIKTTAQMGALKFTSVLSQKEGSSQTETLKSGSKETAIKIRPAEYQFDQHFFLDFYLTQEFERALSNPNVITLPLENLNQIKVYRRITTNSLQNDGIRAVALADLGVVRRPLGGFAAPNMGFDSFQDALLESNRPKENITAQDLGVAEEDFISDVFQELKQGEDYEIDLRLGIISFKSRLNSQQVIAVSYQYTSGGDVIQVGEPLPLGSRQTIYLKMIRPSIVAQSHKLWPLLLKNIYSVGATNLMPEGTDIKILYSAVNPERDFLPGVTTVSLMQSLGLDRLGPQNNPVPDNVIDFGLTFNGNAGTIMFPYLEPFGKRISDLIDQSSAGNKEQLKNDLVFTQLYNRLPNEAQNIPANAIYEISGTTKGGTESFFMLGFALVEGSVRVNANGSALVEGVDFEVDYALGSIRIINQTYLKPGYSISIDYENNNLLQIQQTSFAGVRAEYEVNENLKFGSTIFRLKEQPLTDKIRVGEEPMNNTVIGLDGGGKFDAPWLTRFIDKIPLLQTKEPSNIMFAGEFAQIRPNVARTPAVQDLVDSGVLFQDEKNGVSFIDDFEGVENTISLINAFRWATAASPAGIPGYDMNFDISDKFPTTFDARIARANLRAQLSWYVLPIVRGGKERGPESELIKVSTIFDRQVTNQEDVLRTMDLYYNPTQRGPYNYNMNLRSYLENEPEKMWAGLTTTLPNGSENLNQTNMEFIEFWVQFVLPEGMTPSEADFADYNGRMVVDIGQISEDVIPNSQLNSEDGLSEQQGKTLDGIGQSYIQSAVSVIRDGAFAQASLGDEDVGLDGVKSDNGVNPDNEKVLYRNFVEKMKQDFADKPDVVAKIEKDPSNDDYLFWNSEAAASQSRYYHELFYRYLGYHEGNSNPGTQVYNRPDTEGLQSNNTQTTNRYFQYELNINPADTTSIQIGKNYVVDRTTYGSRFYQRWYQVRIPLREYKRQIGGITDFSTISHVRFWLTGYKKPFTMRFASLEFVGSQWRKATEAYTDDPTVAFKIATINREENSNRRPIPYVVPIGAITAVNRGQQNLVANEQAMLLQVENLPRGQSRFVSRLFTNGLNLLNYENLRMFVHGQGYLRRSDAELVIRLGNDLVNNYYEFRQPVTPSDPDFAYTFPDRRENNQAVGRTSQELERDNEEIWKPDENSINVVLSVFNILKQKRNSIAIEQNIEYEQAVSDLLTDLTGIAPGAKVVIKGNPTLSKINVVALGVSNPSEELPGGGINPDRGTPMLSGEFWVNEMRVSGFDNLRGWKATARTAIKMADFANVSANYNQSTEGFDGIQSKLGERQRFNDRNVDLSGQVNLHKLIPDRFGWNLPVNVSYRNTYRENVFMTQEADIRWTDYQQAVASRTDISTDDKEQALALKKQEIETISDDFTFAMTNIGKEFSKAPLAKALLDNTKLNFSYNVSDSRKPQEVRNYSWNYTSSLTYNYTFKEIKFMAPFKWLKGVPVLNVLDGVRIGLKPTSLSASTNLARRYSETDRRIFAGQNAVPLQQTHDMNAGSNFGINFNLMPTVVLNYSNSSSFNMSNLGIDTTSAIARADTTRYYLNSTSSTLSRILTDPEASAQRLSYAEKWTLSWRPKINSVKALSWLTYSASYNAGFNWQNRNINSLDNAQSQRFGASIDNNGTLTHTLRVGIDDVLKKIPIYQKAQEADKKITRDRDIERKKRQDEAKRKKLEAKKAREAEQAAQKAQLAAKTDVKTAESKPGDATQASGVPKSPQTGSADPAKKETGASKLSAQSPTAKQPEKTESGKPDAAGPKRKTPGQSSDATKSKVAPADSVSKTKKASAEKAAQLNVNPLVYYGRKMLLNATSFKAIDVNYSVRNQAGQAGFAGNAPIYYMFSESAEQISPDLAYRLGLKNLLSTDNIIINERQQVNTTWTRGDNLTARTQFTPIKNMNVDLNWAVEWGEKTDQVFSRDAEGAITSTLGRNGSFSTTTMVFGSGYRDLFERQLGTAFGDINGTNINDTTGNRDGRTVMSLVTLQDDFRSAYMGEKLDKAYGKFGFGAMPLPNWTLTYSGIESAFPFLQDYFSRISLTHGYRGRFRSGYRFNPNAETQNTSTKLGGYTVFQPVNDHTPDQTTLESSFSPLIGLNLTWKNQMRTTFDYESGRRVNVSYTTTRVEETSSKGIKFGLNYEKRGFKLPFMKKLQNTLTSTLNFNYTEEITQRYTLGNDLNRALAADSPALINRDPSLGEVVLDAPTGTGRIQGSLVLGYQFSSMITANFEYTYTHILPRSTNTFERINQDIRFNIVVSIRSN